MRILTQFRPNELTYINLGSMKPFIENLEIPRKRLLRNIRKVNLENYDSELCEIVFDAKEGTYQVIGGLITYFSYKKSYNENTLIPCKVFYHLPKDYRYIVILDYMFGNRLQNWYDRHQILIKLVYEFNHTIADLAEYYYKQQKDIEYYLDPPENYRQEAVRQKKESLINKINLQAFQHQFNKEYLFRIVLYEDVKITDQQLTFLSSLRGNGIKFETRGLSQKQEQLLIDKALSLKEDFLGEIKNRIDDMRMENGDSPIFK